MVQKKTIEEKYKSMTEVEHILLKSGMWIGSINKEEKNIYLYDHNSASIQYKSVEYIPALLKLVDEIISNSVDEYRRSENLGLNHIDISIGRDGYITIKDNGGIPVVKHKEAGLYLPTFLFGNLRTSSNYNDNDNRIGVGTNGLGSVLVNIWSKEFEINTADGKHTYHQSWSNNMVINDDLQINKTTKDNHYTETKFLLDFERLNEDKDSCLTPDFIKIIEKRCIDAAAANIGLSITFKYTDPDTDNLIINEWSFESFNEYIELFSDYADMDNILTYENNFMQLYIFPDNGLNIGFVNGAECSKGTHIKAVRDEINKCIYNQLLNKHKIDIGSIKNADNKYSVFCNFNVNNPTYDSQTKECLTTPVEKFCNDAKYKFNIPDSFLKDISKSEIINLVLDWYKQKCEAEDQKTIRKLNKEAKKKVRNSDKFIDCTSKRREERELWIFEGNSASSSFRTARFPDKQCGYLLRGKILNVSGLSPSKIMENRELSDLVNIIGLQWGQKTNVKELNVSKIVICTDADEDGSAIAGLLLNFFNIWPELYEEHIVCRSISPIVVAKKVNDVKKYYTLPEYKADEKNLKGYTIKYLKGLGSQTDDLARDMFQRPIFHFFTKDEMADISLKAWFGKGNAADRKSMLKKEVEG